MPVIPYLNEDVIIWLFVKYVSKTSIITHDWSVQVEDFSPKSTTKMDEEEQRKKRPNDEFH